MADWTKEEIEKAVQDAKAKSATDKDFRALILSNPNDAIKQVSGKEVPDDYKMKIIEADPAFDQTFTIPPFHTEELSDDELEQVAGGAGRRRMPVNFVPDVPDESAPEPGRVGHDLYDLVCDNQFGACPADVTKYAR